METNKWKAPSWLIPGATVRVFKGRNVPIGVIGTVTSVLSTGNGAKAYVKPNPDSPVALGFEPFFPEQGVSVWITNLEQVNLQPTTV